MELLDLVKDKGPEDPDFGTWFPDTDATVAKALWEQIESAIGPTAAKKDGRNVVWVIKSDITDECEDATAYTLNYLPSVEKTDEEQAAKLPSFKWMKEGDAVLHICEWALDTSAQQLPSCASLKSRQRYGLSMSTLAGVLFHEFMCASRSMYVCKVPWANWVFLDIGAR